MTVIQEHEDGSSHVMESLNGRIIIRKIEK